MKDLTQENRTQQHKVSGSLLMSWGDRAMASVRMVPRRSYAGVYLHCSAPYRAYIL